MRQGDTNTQFGSIHYITLYYVVHEGVMRQIQMFTELPTIYVARFRLVGEARNSKREDAVYPHKFAPHLAANETWLPSPMTVSTEIGLVNAINAAMLEQHPGIKITKIDRMALMLDDDKPVEKLDLQGRL